MRDAYAAKWLRIEADYTAALDAISSMQAGLTVLDDTLGLRGPVLAGGYLSVVHEVLFALYEHVEAVLAECRGVDA